MTPNFDQCSHCGGVDQGHAEDCPRARSARTREREAESIIAGFLEEWWRESLEPAAEVVPVLLERLDAGGFQVVPTSPEEGGRLEALRDACMVLNRIADADGEHHGQAIATLGMIRSQVSAEDWSYLRRHGRRPPWA